jgi:hypothetical protein
MIDIIIKSLLVIAGLTCLAMIIFGGVLIYHYGAGGLIVAGILFLVGCTGLSDFYSEFIRG